MAESPLGHYSPEEELEVFSNWYQQLHHDDPEFAETIVMGMIEQTQVTTQKDPEVGNV